MGNSGCSKSPGLGSSLPSVSTEPEIDGMATERGRLSDKGFSAVIISNFRKARKASTSTAYGKEGNGVSAVGLG